MPAGAGIAVPAAGAGAAVLAAGVAGASLLPQADSDRARAATVRTTAYFFMFITTSAGNGCKLMILLADFCSHGDRRQILEISGGTGRGYDILFIMYIRINELRPCSLAGNIVSTR